MKIEQVLVHYLLKNKKLTLQGIGIFELNASLPDSADPDKPIILPENSVTFYYDPKVTEDEGLVDFIVEHTTKIKPLAASDLDSFLSLGRQFLNIGKPFTLPNIGTLEKLNSGILAFKPGQLIAERIEPNKVRNDENDGTEPEESLFNDYQKDRKSKNGAKVVMVLLILIILGFIGWAVWHYGFNQKNEPDTLTTTEPVVPLKDSTYKSDSAIIAKAAIDSSKNAGDSVTFLIVISRYKSLKSAQWKVKTLKKNLPDAQIFTADSVTYKVAAPFTLPLSDTTKVLDSMKVIYPNALLEMK
ncbi:MAG TPA: hypothetical protein VFU62_07410 [Hanamia sp.]|nr:hypothetical protein [Hanamia sp.]